MSQHDDDIQDVLDRLACLEPAAADAPRPAARALVQLKETVTAAERPLRPGLLRWLLGRRLAASSLLVVLLLLASFSFPTVRAAASDFLGIFRVQKFAAISISPAQIALLQELGESGLYPGRLELIDEPQMLPAVDSAAEAAELLGRPLRSPAMLMTPVQIAADSGGRGRLIIDVESVRAILAAVDVDPGLVPDNLDGQDVQVTVYPSVSQSWRPGIVLVQTASPSIEYPPNVDPVMLGEALLQVLGMDSRQARRLSQSIDWTSTLLLPVPENVATFGEVNVDGVVGLALSSLDGADSALLWQKDGQVYMLSGASVDELIDIGNSLP